MWSIVPDVGILRAGETASVSIRGVLTSDFNGLTHALFKAVSLQSGNSAVAAVNTTFYFCEEVMTSLMRPCVGLMGQG